MLLLDMYHSYVDEIDKRLREVHDHHRDLTTPNALLDIGDYALATRGKMLRGVLLLESCRAVGGDPELAMYAAAGTEYGHLASLVHDDVIDHDELRRNRKTIWHQFGTDYAILTGDFFIFQAYYSLALCRHILPAERVARVLEVLSKACIDLCLGQTLEAQLTGNCAATREDYLKVVRDKTGSLFRAAAESGAILGGGTDEQILATRMYGEHLGIAFQIVDDLLSYVGQTQQIRKPKISDVRNKRITLPILYGLETDDAEDRHTLQRIFGSQDFRCETAEETEALHELVTAILQRSGALKRAEKTAQAFYDQALAYLHALPLNDGRAHLESIALMATRRER
jgi:geranylgeranyl pyrophosphate synthase